MGYGSNGRRDDEATYGYRSQAAYDLIITNQNNKAVQVVAAQASDLEDCLELLAMLGLDAHTVRPVVV
ncbi:MAG: hypothetical protein H0V92_02300 [Pseudonocardiales bacterium]|nr:hypothetical protein [Pseudonocardiales bacterium]